MKSMFTGLATLLALTLLLGTAHAQWPDDPASNLEIASGTGEQTTPIVEPTSDGGCYVVYYSNASGNYDVYLQRFDADGVPQWPDGLLISDNTMTSFITEWDFAVDANDNAIIATNDVRNGPDWDIYGYSIAPDGTFNWGPDGIALSDDTLDDVAQQIMVTSDNDIVFAWQSDQDIALRRVDADGNDVWDPATVYVSSTYQVSIPRMAPTSDGGFMLLHVVSQGSQFWSPRHLYLEKFDANGQPQWGGDGVAINNVGGIGIQMRPKVVNDGSDGAICYWYDDHLSLQMHVFVQHVRHDGIVLWQENGIQASLDPTQLQMTPTLDIDADGDIYVFYQTTNLGQTQSGLGGQKLDLSGNRLWGDNGISVVPLGSNQPYSQYPFAMSDGGVVVPYLENEFGGTNTWVNAVRVDEDGNLAWGGLPVALSTVASDKLHHSATQLTSEQVVSVWVDKRNDTSGDLYLQNVNPDGSLGPYGQPDPVYVELLNPAPLVIPAGGGTITYDVHIVNNTGTSYSNIFYFTDVELPNGNFVTGIFSQRFTLTAGMDITVAGPGQNVPAFAPAGMYTYYGSIGYPNGPHRTDSFQFEKTAAAADGVADWSTHGTLNLTASVANKAGETLPNAYALSEAYPNPFNPTATISVALPLASELTVRVVNTLGQTVAELAHGSFTAGTHSFVVDGSNFASGIYFVQATVPGELNAVRKIVLMK